MNTHSDAGWEAQLFCMLQRFLQLLELAGSTDANGTWQVQSLDQNRLWHMNKKSLFMACQQDRKIHFGQIF